MIIKFENWIISVPSISDLVQFDNLSDRIIIEGDIPSGWQSWSLLVRAGNNNNVLTLVDIDGELGVIITEDMLAIGNAFYDFQLRGENGELTKHSNVVSVFVPPTISGSGTWPMTPSEFLQAEARLRDINAHPPIPAEDGEHWALWDYAQQEYETSEFPLPEGAGGFSIHGLTAESEIVDADELPFYDESAHGQRKTTWQNIKSKLKAYFDDLYIKATELQSAINTALTIAKESGEFNGEQGPAGPPGADGQDGADGAPGRDGLNGRDGRDGTDGADGITPHIGANGNWYIGNTDTGNPSRGEAGQNGVDGEDGADGYTPVKGVDYFTDADKAEIAAAAAEEIDLSDYQASTITDSAGYFTSDTVEGALAEIGAELSGINTLVGSGVIV